MIRKICRKIRIDDDNTAVVADIARYRPFDSSDLDAEGTSLYIAFLQTPPSAEAEQKLMAFRS